MRRGWVGATAEMLVAGPSRGRGRRRVRNRYAVTEKGLIEVCSHEELLDALKKRDDGGFLSNTSPSSSAHLSSMRTSSTKEITTR